MTEEFRDDELEKQLQEAARDLRLQAPQRVWKGVRDELHPHRKAYRRAAVAAVLLLLAAGLYLGTKTGPASGSRKTAQPSPAMAGGQPASLHRATPASPATAPASAGARASASGASAAASVPAAPVSGKSRLTAAHPAGRPATAAVAAVTQERGWALPLLDGSTALFPAPVVGPEAVSHLQLPPDIAAGSALPLKEAPTSRKAKTLARRKAAFGFFFTPSAGYRIWKNNAGSPVAAASPRLSFLAATRPPTPVKLRQEPDFGWTAGAQVMLPVGGPWLFRSGLSVSRTGYRLMAYGAYPAYVRGNGTVSYTAVDGHNNSFYAADRSQAMSSRPSFVHVRYLTAGIPLMLAGEFGRPGNLSYTITGGAVLGWVLSSDPVIYSPDSKRYFTGSRYVRRFRTGLNLEALVNVPLHGALQISTGPSLQYQLSSSYRNYPQVKEHPYLLGISAGLQWRR